ncbi:TSUP family transporter [Streptomyces sp. NPDC101455]|uniref:TSUP family transporter n=1 Tax=Streptomyces sp. NPDC101455 TaxID=3366142 RepID=UPI003808608A
MCAAAHPDVSLLGCGSVPRPGRQCPPRLRSRLRALLGAAHGDHRAKLHADTFVGAVYGGCFGGGPGVVLVALLGLTLSVPLARANVLKEMLQLVVATVSLVVFALLGPVRRVVAPLSLAGGVLGGLPATRLGEPVLRASEVGFGVRADVWLGSAPWADARSCGEGQWVVRPWRPATARVRGRTQRPSSGPCGSWPVSGGRSPNAARPRLRGRGRAGRPDSGRRRSSSCARQVVPRR